MSPELDKRCQIRSVVLLFEAIRFGFLRSLSQSLLRDKESHIPLVFFDKT
jgi:hypothetical protein